jgi:hypothetical protein
MANSETYPVVMLNPVPCRWMGTLGSASSTALEGFVELGTGTATAHQLNVNPELGKRVNITLTGTATGGITVVTQATGETITAAGGRTITFTGKSDNVQLMGVSTTRWTIIGSRGCTFS